MTDDPTKDRSNPPEGKVPMTWMRRTIDRVRVWTPAQGPRRLAAQLPPEGFFGASHSAVLPPEAPAPPTPPTNQVEANTAAAHEAPQPSELATEVDLVAPTLNEERAAQAALEMRIHELENELNEVRSQYAESVKTLRRASFELSLRVDRDVVRLARRLAEVIVRRKIELEADVVIEGLKAAFRLAGPMEKVTVKCSPDDVEFLRSQSEAIAHDHLGRWVEVAVQPSADIDRGGVLLLYEGGVVDARLPSQLDRLTALVERVIGSQNYDFSQVEDTPLATGQPDLAQASELSDGESGGDL